MRSAPPISTRQTYPDQAGRGGEPRAREREAAKLRRSSLLIGLADPRCVDTAEPLLVRGLGRSGFGRNGSNSVIRSSV